MTGTGLVGRRRRGFTIIELLVVIAVISILMGIILPVLPKVRDSARRAGCGSNQRQVGMVMETFKGDHKLKYPEARSMPDPWLTLIPDVPSLNKAMEDYLDEKSEAWKCPGDSDVYGVEYTDLRGDKQIGGSSYSYVVALSGRTIEETFFHERLHWPTTQVPVIKDFDGSDLEYNVVMGSDEWDSVQPGFFHSRRNILFADGHVGIFD